MCTDVAGEKCGAIRSYADIDTLILGEGLHCDTSQNAVKRKTPYSVRPFCFRNRKIKMWAAARCAVRGANLGYAMALLAGC